MTTAQPAPFDPVKYKNTTRDQWDTAAEAWFRWTPTLMFWLDPATDIMFDMAGLTTGQRVLNVAAGCGGEAILAARRVGPSGKVVATDISAQILKFAERAAKEAGLANVETRAMDGENLAVEQNHYDVVISRVGLIYFPDQQKALSGMKNALKAGGRVAAIVYSTADNNKFFSVPVSIIRRRAQLPAPAPGQPGPFSLGGPGVLADVLKKAGFRDVQTRNVPAPLKMPSSADCVRFEKESFGALHQMLAGLDDKGKKEAWDEISAELKSFDTAGGFVGPCELVIGAGVK